MFFILNVSFLINDFLGMFLLHLSSNTPALFSCGFLIEKADAGTTVIYLDFTIMDCTKLKKVVAIKKSQDNFRRLLCISIPTDKDKNKGGQR